MLAAAAALLLALGSPSTAQECEAVERSADPLPGDDPAAWKRLLASPTPLLFPAQSSRGTASASGSAGGGSELQRVAATWSWRRIGKGLGSHVQGFVGQAGATRFPYYEGNMPLERVSASRGLNRSAGKIP